MNKTEAGTEYFIPIPNQEIDPGWQQSCAIPTIQTKLQIHGMKPIIRLRFSVDPENPSGLDIRAGGGDLEIAGHRIRAQMIHRLKTSQDLLQRSDPPPGLVLLIGEISKYFTLCNDSNVQRGR